MAVVSPPARDDMAGIGRDMAWNYLPVAATITVTLAVTATAARVLGVAAFGLFSLCLAVVSLLQLIDPGLTLAITRTTSQGAADLPRRPESVRQVRAIQGSYATVAIIVLFAVMLTTPFADRFTRVPDALRWDFRMTYLLTGLSAVVFLALAGAQGILLGTKHFRAAGSATAAGAAVNLTLVLVLIHPLGLPALGVGQLVGVLTGRTLMTVQAHRAVGWMPALPRPAGLRVLAEVTKAEGSLFLVAVAAQGLALSDMLVIGAFVGPDAAGVYRVAATLATQASGVLFQGYDVAFPTLAGHADRQGQIDITLFLSRGAAFVAGLGFGFLAVNGHQVIHLLTGHDSSLGAATLALFSTAWAVNTFTHGWSTLILARGLSSRFVVPVVTEATANLVLTLALVPPFGAVASGWATLAAVAVSNLLLFPRTWRGEVPLAPVPTLIRSGALPASCGLAVAVAGHLIASPSGADPAARLCIALVFTAVAGVVAASVLLGKGGRRQVAVMLGNR